MSHREFIALGTVDNTTFVCTAAGRRRWQIEMVAWLAAVKVANTLDPIAVMKQLQSKPINDFMTKDGHVQLDGSLVRDMYLFEVKKPSESNGEWDLYKLVREIPGRVAYKRPDGNACPLVKGQ